MRFFLTLLFVLALSILADAQQPRKVARIGFLAASSPFSYLARTPAFREGLRDLGYIEGKNLVIEYRYADGEARSSS
jgi:putative tryptophan/tyrosine transport system substrate-binding protein